MKVTTMVKKWRGVFIALTLFMTISLWGVMDTEIYHKHLFENFAPVDGLEDGAISQEDVYISIKTTAKNVDSRVELILKTWWDGVKKHAYFFTDPDDSRLVNITSGHAIRTNCGSTHFRLDLCCKFGQEYDHFYDSGKKWWCHFDDDNYVNPLMLFDMLRQYDWEKAYYIGRPSREGDQTRRYKKKTVILRFATLGAGMCVTRNASEMMSPWMRNGTFVKTCQDLSQPDDVTFGFIATNRLGLNLTRRNDFNSHTQDLQTIPREDLMSQIVLSYSYGKKNGHTNIINLTDEISPFPLKDDKTRMLSYHCLKHPETSWCPKSEDHV